jgi:hypothetical protein
MHIIDKNKDYYDYLQKIYGRDTTITYDRRGSKVLSNQALWELIAPIERYYNKKDGALFVLEVGYTQYLFRAFVLFSKPLKYTMVSMPCNGRIELVHIFEDHKHYFDAPMTLVSARGANSFWYSWKPKKSPQVWNYSELNVDTKLAIPNPILKGTTLPSWVDAQKIWIGLSNFISAKYNDKTIEIVNTDVEKAVQHGFDKVSSFRNPIKL